jgi:outer membrane biosynthesis protein TonB
VEALSPELALVDAELAAVARAALVPAPDVFAAIERPRANRDVIRRLRMSFDEQEAAAAEVAAPRRRSGGRRRLAGLAFASTFAAGAIVTGALALGHDEVTEPRALASNAPAPADAPAPAPAARRAATPRRSVGKAVARRPEPAVTPEPKARPAAVTAKPKAEAKPKVVAAPRPAHKAATHARPKRHTTPAAVVTPKAPPVLSWPLARQATYYRLRVYRVTGQFLFEVWSDKTRVAVPATWKSGSTENRLTPGRYGWAVYPAFGDLGEPSNDPAVGTPIAGGHFTV